STYFYKNTAENAGGGDQFTDTIGIVLALDVSLSMRNANFIGEGGMDYLPASATGPAFLSNASPATNVKLPMRSSSGLDGYDPYAVASPYLVYRAGVQDLFFAKGVDDPATTQYDERYNPCYAAQATNPLYMASYPATASDPLSTVVATKTEMDTNCSFPAGGVFPTGANAEAIFVKLPTTQTAAQQAVIAANVTAFDASVAATIANWSGPAQQLLFGNGCLNTATVQSSTCPYFDTDGNALFYNGNGLTPVALADYQATEKVVTSMMANPGDLNIVPVALSRIEAARTAMLSFVLTIESNAALVDNFRLGLVPFSTIVNDGTSGYPDEVETLAEPNASSKFQDLKDKLYRLNRACNSAAYTYSGISAAATCPAGTEPFTLTGQTNLAQALYYSQRQFQVFDPANNKLAAKLVVLLTDGAPTASATSWNTTMGTHADEPAHLGTVTGALHSDNIDVYAIGLLTAGDPSAQNALNAIGNSFTENSVTYVDSVADLSPIFENIAQQAERLLLQAMKDRYQYLNY
ncbi:MAG: VWA domain-containing protein, partial [Vampirovibrionia bacterium]